MTISTRFRAPIFAMMLARWVLTVLRLMLSSAAISGLVRPRATATTASSSRRVSGSIGCFGGGPGRGGGGAGGWSRDLRGDQRAPRGRRMNRLDQEVRSGVLEQEPARARFQRAVHVGVEV